MKSESYDLIGDIHGQAAVLRDLLARLGYRHANGAYRHPERRVIFLGDYVDRGPAIRETLQIVRAMVDAGTARALCGNHELDVLSHDTPDGRGGYVRPHGGRHTAMHRETHAEFTARPEEWREWLRWIQTLPLYLDLLGLRAVHACWDPRQIAVLGGRRLDDALLSILADPARPETVAVNRLLKGPEVPLPAGTETRSRMGYNMREMRLRWWRDGRGQTYREACINLYPGPEVAIPREYDDLFAPPAGNERPTFIGHYWLPAAHPTLLAPNVACLDYSVASGGPLVAYRWDGEQVLSPKKFVYDPARVPEGYAE